MTPNLTRYLILPGPWLPKSRNGVLDIRLEYNKKLQELNAAKTKEERTRLKGEVDALRLSMLQTKLSKNTGVGSLSLFQQMFLTRN